MNNRTRKKDIQTLPTNRKDSKFIMGTFLSSFQEVTGTALDLNEKDKKIIALLKHPDFIDVASDFVDNDFKDSKKGFEIRNRTIPKWVASEETWINAEKEYYMPGLPICIKSASRSLIFNKSDFSKLIREHMSKITNEDIFASLPTEGSIILFDNEIDAKKYVRAMRGNIYDDLTCSQSAIFEVNLRDACKTSNLKEGTITIEEKYNGDEDKSNSNVIFIETDINNVTLKKVNLTIESIIGRINKVTCLIEYDNPLLSNLVHKTAIKNLSNPAIIKLSAFGFKKYLDINFNGKKQNLDVVDNLIQYFGQLYSVAYHTTGFRKGIPKTA